MIVYNLQSLLREGLLFPEFRILEKLAQRYEYYLHNIYD